MKRALLLLAFVIISMTSMAEEIWLTAKSISFKNEYQSEFDKWKPCNIPIMIDFERKRLVIKSKEEQIIDWVSMEEKTAYDSGDSYITSLATDTKYQTIRLEIWYQTTQMVIRIYYSDFQYQYRIPKTIYQ